MHLTAAVACANLRHSSSSAFVDGIPLLPSISMRPATKESPAAVVSTTSTLKDG
ncbi:MAG: hypothetical protein RAK25_00950 [TACK group archaeon]|nr:hypothetical protein [TACK group archaeon]